MTGETVSDCRNSCHVCPALEITTELDWGGGAALTGSLLLAEDRGWLAHTRPNGGQGSTYIGKE